ncbi:hypothetical protein KC19_4G167800 [Ceratodon purpureus]|uniref:Protein kinase domain-containing protein n=1 Tax=Ceratodon purpureus TaxID=3225 RepID=A0A8T0IBN6_CERPU|nr:hypothetical protein KC19_4G167800 [Ceratodon purpureus]
MAERGSINHPSGLPETELVTGEESGNVGLVEALDPYLKRAEKCIEAVQKIPSRKFNREQCEYLAQKLEKVVRSISNISEVSRAKCHGFSSFMNVSGGVKIVNLVLALAKQIESFVQGCCKDEWIQSAMALTNVSEYVSSVGFNLELCKVAFRKVCAATAPLTLDEVDGIYRGEVEIVETKASADVDVLFDQLILKMPSLSDENKDLATYLLQRLRRVIPETGSTIPKYSLVSADDRGFWGKLFKRVQETGRLGTCGSGATVDKATWLGTLVAVKTFYGPEDSEFIKEVDIVRRLCHPNITSMFCSAMDRRRCSIVMELMDEDLLALMQRRLDQNIDSPPFSIWEAIDIMLQIGEGVNYLHLHTIVHRDLKSMNILVKSVEVGDSEIGYLQVKVADFGLSKVKETSTRFSAQTGNTGTNRWMAPEIIHLPEGEGSLESHSKNAKMPKYPCKMDVYSFAMVCYEILTGQVPFHEISNPNQVKRKILNGDRPQLPDHCPLKQLKTLIEECWNQEPVKRPTFAAICKRLRWIKYLLMTSYHLTIEKPLQREHPVQGKSRLYQVIRKKINPENINKVHVIGLHGMAGIGKSTMCKVFCDELTKDFLGKVCYAEMKTRSQVEVLRHVLWSLTNLSDKLLSKVNIDQYYERLQNHIHQHRVLLVIDNVPDSLKAIEAAKRYLIAEYAPGSVVLVATRSLGILQSLNIDERDCLEMPKLEEEEARSLFLYYAAPVYDVDPKLLERCMRSAEHFFGEDDDIFSVKMMPCEDDDIHYHYHPVVLRELGMQLGILPKQWEKKLTKLRFGRFRLSFDMLTLGSRPSFLRKSFDMLSLEDRLLHMDAALFNPEPSQEGSILTQLNIFTWLSLLHGISVGAIMTRLEGLKNKLLLEHSRDGSTRIAMHPLVRQFCKSEANVGNLQADGGCSTTQKY